MCARACASSYHLNLCFASSNTCGMFLENASPTPQKDRSSYTARKSSSLSTIDMTVIDQEEWEVCYNDPTISLSSN